MNNPSRHFGAHRFPSLLRYPDVLPPQTHPVPDHDSLAPSPSVCFFPAQLCIPHVCSYVPPHPYQCWSLAFLGRHGSLQMTMIYHVKGGGDKEEFAYASKRCKREPEAASSLTTDLGSGSKAGCANPKLHNHTPIFH